MAGTARKKAPAQLAVVTQRYEAELGEVRDFAESLSMSYLECRELGHLWRPYTAGRHRDGGFDRTLRCSRCKTKRVQEITSRGVVVTNKYVHPEGYLHKGMGRIVGDGRGILRLEALKRLVAKDDAAQSKAG